MQDNRDKRVELLQKYAFKFFPSTKYLNYALQVETYTLQKAANLVLNVDGCIGTLFLDLLHSSSLFTEVCVLPLSLSALLPLCLQYVVCFFTLFCASVACFAMTAFLFSVFVVTVMQFPFYRGNTLASLLSSGNQTCKPFLSTDRRPVKQWQLCVVKPMMHIDFATSQLWASYPLLCIAR